MAAAQRIGSWLSNVRGDVAGALACAILTLPGSAGVGVIAFAPLGEQYTPHAVLAGLYPAIILPLVALLLGARSIQLYSPRSVLAILIASVVAEALVTGPAPIVDPADVSRTAAMLFLVVFVAGFFQAVFGVSGLGTLVQYIPSPVMAGFQNAGAVLIFVGQIGPVLGVPDTMPLTDVAAVAAALQPLTLMVGVTTGIAMWYAPRLAPSVPPPAVGLLAGSVAYYAVAALAPAGALGPVVGAVPASLPLPTQLDDFAALLGGADRWRILAAIVSGALSLAIVASLDGLLSAKAIEQAVGVPAEGNRTLFRLGTGNMVTACFGGVTGSLNIVGTLASRRAGATSPVSVLAFAVIMLAAVVLLPPVIALIPRVVIAGMLLVIAIQMVDTWTLQMIRRVASREVAQRRRVMFDLFVIALVAGAAIAVNLVVAVGVGVVVAILSFLFRMSRSVVRRAYRGTARHSRRVLEARLMELLQEHAHRILVFELEGPLFFGTAEHLARRVDAALAEDARVVIFDMKRVNEVDSTGARILLQIHDRLRRQGRHLLLSHLEPHGAVASVLRDMGVFGAVTADRVFTDTDRALEWAEDRLIEHLGDGAALGGERRLDEMDALEGLEPHELDVLRGFLTRQHFAPGQLVFREGEHGRELFLIARGTASVTLRLGNGQRTTRLATFSAGTIFGELALLDPGPRSASVEADQELVCYVLTEGDFERLRKDHPAIAIKFLANLGRELSRRVRRSNRTIYELEE